MRDPISAAFSVLRPAHGKVAAGLLIATTAGLVLLQDFLWIVLVPCLIALAVRHIGGSPRTFRVSWTSPLVWMLLLYCAYLLGLAWSTNFDYALFDLQVKAPMLVVPLVVFSVPEGSRIGGRELLLVFSWACALAVAFCAVVACWRYGTHWWGYHVSGTATVPTTVYFISSEFSRFMHPSYFALYLCFALASCDFPSTRWSRVDVLLMSLIVLGILLSASKAGWIALAAYWGALGVVRWKDREERKRRLIAGTLVAAVLALLVFASPFFSEKVDQFKNAAQGAPVDVSAAGSTESREMIWGEALPLIREHLPLGTGTGDVKDVLLANYAEAGFTHAVELKLNAHSQLLQTPLTLGLIGAVLLLLLFALPMIHAARHRDGLMLAFLCFVLFNWAVESMLETQAGVVFLAWGALLLAFRAPDTSA